METLETSPQQKEPLENQMSAPDLDELTEEELACFSAGVPVSETDYPLNYSHSYSKPREFAFLG